MLFFLLVSFILEKQNEGKYYSLIYEEANTVQKIAIIIIFHILE